MLEPHTVEDARNASQAHMAAALRKKGHGGDGKQLMKNAARHYTAKESKWQQSLEGAYLPLSLR